MIGGSRHLQLRIDGFVLQVISDFVGPVLMPARNFAPAWGQFF
jgi:hypothetical protein